jgi:RNA polymerase sigma-70 factor (ECF subfamily)
LVTDHHRRAGRSLPLLADERLVSNTADPEQVVQSRLTQHRLVAALAHLTEDQRQVIILKFVEGLDNKTTARALGKSVGAVKALQHRALAALQRILDQDVV